MEMVTVPLRFGLLTTCFLATTLLCLCRIIGAPVGSSLASRGHGAAGASVNITRRHDWLGSWSLHWNVIAKFFFTICRLHMGSLFESSYLTGKRDELTFAYISDSTSVVRDRE